METLKLIGLITFFSCVGILVLALLLQMSVTLAKDVVKHSKTLEKTAFYFMMGSAVSFGLGVVCFIAALILYSVGVIK